MKVVKINANLINHRRRLYAAIHGEEAPLNTNVLKDKDLKILTMMSEGFTTKEISSALFYGKGTVDNHVGKMLEQFECKNSNQLISKAKDLKII